MIFPSITRQAGLLVLATLSRALVDAAADDGLVLDSRGIQIVPFAPTGQVASVQDYTGRTISFYQKADASIWQWGTIGPFSTGISNASDNVQVVPAAEAMPISPIAVTEVYQPFTDNGASIRVFFFSKTAVVSEYIWRQGQGWTGGTTCVECLTTKGFTALSSSKVLYAMRLQNGQQLRVGFVSSGVPGTLSEADSSGAGDWVIAGLPLAV